MVDENGMDGHTTMQPEKYHPIAWLCYTWVECFTLPSAGNEMGQWTRVRPLNRDNTLAGALPFGEALLCVGKCVKGLITHNAARLSCYA